MQLSPVKLNSSYNNNLYKYKNCSFGKTITPQMNHLAKPKHIVKGAILGLMALTAATCSNLRGGNLIYNEASEKIEHFENFKTSHKLDVI